MKTLTVSVEKDAFKVAEKNFLRNNKSEDYEEIVSSFQVNTLKFLFFTFAFNMINRLVNRFLG